MCVCAFRCVVLFLFVAVSGERRAVSGFDNLMIYIVRLDVYKKCRCRSWSDSRGRNLVLGNCTLEDSLAFLVILSEEKNWIWTVGLGIADCGLSDLGFWVLWFFGG